MKVHPAAATAALLVDHATHVLTDTPIDLAKTRACYELLCETYPPADRADSCAKLTELRSMDKIPLGVKHNHAKAALQIVIASSKASGPPSKP
jgi:hypothetical protein